MTVAREGTKAAQGARNRKFFVVALPENAWKRDRIAIMPTKALSLVDFLSSEGVINLPQSVFLGSMLLRRWQ
jgi:hypothetical protein